MFINTEVISYNSDLDANYPTKCIINYSNVNSIDIGEDEDSEFYGYFTIRFTNGDSVITRQLPKGLEVC